MSASSNARIGSFPPSSRPTLIIFFAALSYTCFPVSTPPVNEIARMSGWDTRPSPTTEPVPVNMLTTPGGNPASSRTSTNLAAQSGVKEEGLRTKEHLAMTRSRRIPPFLERGLRGVDGLAHLLHCRVREGREDLARGRVARLEAFPLRFPPFAGDEKAVFLDHDPALGRRRRG